MSGHVVLVGTTASGKSALAMELARRAPDFEIVVADSMQGYRGMDIGTAKPTAEERREVAHHLLDVLDPDEELSLAAFLEMARAAISDIASRGKRALVVGGTGLYVQALVDGYDVPGLYPEVRKQLDDVGIADLYGRLHAFDPTAASLIEPGNERRIRRALEVCLGSGRPFSSFGPDAQLGIDCELIGLWIPRDVNALRIEERVRQMMTRGWAAEVENLLAGPRLSRTAAKAIGYSTIIDALHAGRDVEDSVGEIVQATKSFARRQRVWFRRDRRIRWYGTALNPEQVWPAVLSDLAGSSGLEGGDS